MLELEKKLLLCNLTVYLKMVRENALASYLCSKNLAAAKRITKMVTDSEQSRTSSKFETGSISESRKISMKRSEDNLKAGV